MLKVEERLSIKSLYNKLLFFCFKETVLLLNNVAWITRVMPFKTLCSHLPTRWRMSRSAEWLMKTMMRLILVNWTRLWQLLVPLVVAETKRPKWWSMCKLKLLKNRYNELILNFLLRPCSRKKTAITTQFLHMCDQNAKQTHSILQSFLELEKERQRKDEEKERRNYEREDLLFRMLVGKARSPAKSAPTLPSVMEIMDEPSTSASQQVTVEFEGKTLKLILKVGEALITGKDNKHYITSADGSCRAIDLRTLFDNII